MAARLFLGQWAFEGAGGIAALWLIAGVYLYIRSRRLRRAPDPSTVLDEAIQRFRAGETERAVAMLDRVVAENPWFWQGLQCRGEIRLHAGDAAGALADFDAAIRLAPEEPHLRELRSQAATGPIPPSPDGSS